jgi:enamine deaminase RidA (YjgF/YER057c/UK114 family)
MTDEAGVTTDEAGVMTDEAGVASGGARHIDVVQPAGWRAPRGYSNGMSARGRSVFVAGQIGWDADAQFHSDGLVDQFRQALSNVCAVVAAAGGGVGDIVRMTIYVTDIEAYRACLAEVGRAYRDVMAKHFPAMALLGVVALVEPRAKVEIEATAVIADGVQEEA